jgi:uncharacterized protein (DUF305 family)
MKILKMPFPQFSPSSRTGLPLSRRSGRGMRFAAAGAVVAAISTLATGCGSDSSHGSGSASASATHKAPNGEVYDNADVTFATQMIPHHAQAVQMVTMTDGRQMTPEFRELTGNIRDAQVPEIEQMSGWLTDWGKKVPETSNDHVNAGHDMDDMDSGSGMSGMPGAMSQDDFDELKSTTGNDFESMWLTMMIRHHEGAIKMARTEIRNGKSADAIKLAKSIETSQAAEIKTMKAMLART